MFSRRGGRFQTFNRYKKHKLLTEKQKDDEFQSNPNNKNSRLSELEDTFDRAFFFRPISNKNELLENEISKIENDLKKLKRMNIKDEIRMVNYIKEKEKSLNSSIEIKNGFIKLLIYILQKSLKTEIEVEILKNYFLSLEKLVALLWPLDININDMMSKLSTLMQLEKKSDNYLLWKSGDVCQKLNIIIKGNVRILKTIEKDGECSKLEYVKYLIILYLYQENCLISNIISQNNKIIKITDKHFFTLLTIFKYYRIFTINEKFNDKYKSIKEFIEGENNLNDYIFKLYNFDPKESLTILDYNDNIIKELYNFYISMINEINNGIEFSIPQKKFLNEEININMIYDSKKLNKIMFLLDIYFLKGQNFKRLNELYEKISLNFEIDSPKIYEANCQEYLNRLDFEANLKKIRKYDKYYKLIKSKSNKNLLNPITIKYFSYREVSILREGNIFGENAIKDLNSKANETIITSDDCSFAVITKSIFDISLKSAQDKAHIRNIFVISKCPIFKGISMNYFLKKIFKYFKQKTLKKGDILFRKGDKRDKIYFIIKGELEFSLNITISEINDIIKELGGEIDYKKLEYIFDDYPKLKKYFNEKKMDINFFSLKDTEIAGLDDITVKNKYLFDCTCTSLNKTEVFELKYSIFEDYIRLENLINENHENYINLKRNIIIKRILEKRNGLCLNEVNRINLGKIKKIIGKNVLEDGYLPMTFPDPIIKQPPPLKTKIKKMCQKKKVGKKKNSNLKVNTNYFDIFKSKNSFLKKKSFKLLKQNNESEDKLLTTKKTRNKNYMQELIDMNMHTAQEEERIKTINKMHFFDKIKLSHKYNIGFDSNYVKKRKKLNTSTNSDELNTPKNNKFETFSEEFLNKTFTKFGYRKYFKRICNKPLIPDIINTRTKKNIVPFSSKISLKKNIKKNLPIFYKQTSRKFIDKRSMATTDSNFYKCNQHIFNSLLNESNPQNKTKSISLVVKNEEISNINKMKFINKKPLLSHTPNNKIRNKLIFHSINNYQKNIFSKLFPNKNKNYGIIDCLFLDNWEEKTQFERKFFFKNINK